MGRTNNTATRRYAPKYVPPKHTLPPWENPFLLSHQEKQNCAACIPSEEDIKQNVENFSARYVKPIPNLPQVFDLLSLSQDITGETTEILKSVLVKRKFDESNEIVEEKKCSVTVRGIFSFEIWENIMRYLDFPTFLQFRLLNHRFLNFCLHYFDEKWINFYITQFGPIKAPNSISNPLLEDGEIDYEYYSLLNPLSDEYLLAYAGRLLPLKNDKQISWLQNILIRKKLEDVEIKNFSFNTNNMDLFEANRVLSKIKFYKVSSRYEVSEDREVVWNETQIIGFSSICRPIYFLVRINEHPTVLKTMDYIEKNQIELDFSQVIPRCHPCRFEDQIIYETFVYDHRFSQWIPLGREIFCERMDEFDLQISSIIDPLIDMVLDIPVDYSQSEELELPDEYRNLCYGSISDLLVSAVVKDTTFATRNTESTLQDWIKNVQNYPHLVRKRDWRNMPPSFPNDKPNEW